MNLSNKNIERSVKMFQIGIDMGGTFTDFIAIGNEEFKTVKIPSNKEYPIQTVLRGLEELATDFNMQLEEFLSKTHKLVHGNTVAINALLQRKGVKTALISTKGFTDTLEMRRARLDNQWDFFSPIPKVLVPRHLRLPVSERVDYSGKVLQELVQEDVEEILEKLQKEKVESVAVCTLFSFMNPSHEKAIKEYIEERLDNVFVSISSEVSPKLGEYERVSTTVLNAYLTPLVSRYLDELSHALKERGLKTDILLVQNNGGLAHISYAKDFGVKGLFSGPAAGSSGAKALGEKVLEPNLILVDMGGTSFDVSLVSDYEIKIMPEAVVGGYPVNLPLVDIESVGIGGGSIASIGVGAMLSVGPQSAESYPGPACYDRGGEEPTITDAALVLGFIEEGNFGGGTMKIRKDLAAQAIEDKIAKPLHMSVEDGAYGIYQIALAKMVDAVHLMTIQKGHDPRDFALCAVGGASPIFACNIAEEMGSKIAIIPANGEVFCAQGMLESQIKLDMVQSIVQQLAQLHFDEINSTLKGLKEDATSQLKAQGILVENLKYKFLFEIRYEDQHHTLPVHFKGEKLDEHNIKELLDEFHNLHEKSYGYSERNQECTLISIRLEMWEESLNQISQIERPVASVEPLIPSYRKVCFDGKGVYNEIPVYKEKELSQNHIIAGPALIEKDYTSIFINPRFDGRFNEYGDFILRKRGSHI